MRSFFRVLSILLLVVWMGVIFSFSAQPAEESTKLSGGVIETIAEKFYPGYSELLKTEREELVSSFQFVTRKSAHVASYALLGMLSFLTFISYVKLKFFTRVGLGMALSVLYAASDEIHQYFVPGRSCELRDFALDAAGVLLATLICVWAVKRSDFLNRKTAFAGDNQKQLQDINGELSSKLDDMSYQNKGLEKQLEIQEQTIQRLVQEMKEQDETLFAMKAREAALEQELQEAHEAEILQEEEPVEMEEPQAEEAAQDAQAVEEIIENAEEAEEILEEAEAAEEIAEDVEEFVQEPQFAQEALEEISEEQMAEETQELAIEEPQEAEQATEYVAEETPTTTKVAPKGNVLLCDEMKYAAAEIGKVVVEVTKVCNKLALSADEQNKKELVNLALGRSEVYKAQILRILESEVGFAEKQKMIEQETKETFDYFDSIIAQMC